MIIDSAAVIYFSPTGTTKKILYAITEGMGIDNLKYINLTLPDVRKVNAPVINEDIIIIGTPVYEERVPEMLYPFLTSLTGNNKPVVLAAVYGNIGEGNALNELQTITESSGFKVIAAGSFIGEHSFSTKELPIAEGRPNQDDIKRAQDFGKAIIGKLKTIDDLNGFSLQIPQGKLPLMSKILPANSARMFTKTPSADMSVCNHCGVCVKLCPVSAIDENTLEINDNQCLRCFSCVKRCQRKARMIIYKKKYLVTRVLTAKSKVEKEPKVYFL